MCDCFSYNGDSGTVPQRLLDARPYFHHNWPSDVPVDDCIANDVLALWAAGIWTINSCCGHNKQERAIILETGFDADRARAILGPRTTIIYWKLGEHKP